MYFLKNSACAQQVQSRSLLIVLYVQLFFNHHLLITLCYSRLCAFVSHDMVTLDLCCGHLTILLHDISSIMVMVLIFLLVENHHLFPYL